MTVPGPALPLTSSVVEKPGTPCVHLGSLKSRPPGEWWGSAVYVGGGLRGQSEDQGPEVGNREGHCMYSPASVSLSAWAALGANEVGTAGEKARPPRSCSDVSFC